MIDIYQLGRRVYDYPLAHIFSMPNKSVQVRTLSLQTAGAVSVSDYL